ncbi:hypothetical protein F9802_13455 [Bacillus aerolatus]|uniref:Uncharacterized protein n=1 Tax=Bacillus aerolatus TaxID=2653354 RepID=A0A6I1FHJ3_9BACI|nr:hypothetical protein [Bacillus aerolatus]KAB7705543.1 hypothetical protein F9802_13455 [Bacillus aerolatus]
MKQAQNLDELIDFAQSVNGDKELFICQQESSPSGVSLGDEDTGGTDVEMNVKILLEASKSVICYEKVYENSVQYEEDSTQMKELEQAVPSQRIAPSDMEEKMKKYAQ